MWSSSNSSRQEHRIWSSSNSSRQEPEYGALQIVPGKSKENERPMHLSDEGTTKTDSTHYYKAACIYL
jgi:hypothetical protein